MHAWTNLAFSLSDKVGKQRILEGLILEKKTSSFANSDQSWPIPTELRTIV